MCEPFGTTSACRTAELAVTPLTEPVVTVGEPEAYAAEANSAMHAAPTAAAAVARSLIVVITFLLEVRSHRFQTRTDSGVAPRGWPACAPLSSPPIVTQRSIIDVMFTYKFTVHDVHDSDLVPSGGRQRLELAGLREELALAHGRVRELELDRRVPRT